MRRAKFTIFWPLRLIAVLSLVGPALFFSYRTVQNRHSIDQQANERIERALDVLQEHAQKGLQTVELAISEVNEVLRDLPDDRIRARESDLFLRLKRTQQGLPQIEAIWVFDRTGHPLVSSTILPVPQSLNNADRSYFSAQKDGDAGTFISEVVRARIGSLSFFVVSGRRTGAQAGQFDGVVAVTVMPEHFSEFYRKLTRGHDSFALVRADGGILARYPELRVGDLNTPSEAASAIRQDSGGGMVTGTFDLDGIERRIGFRPVPGFDVYVTTGVETAALTAEFRDAVQSDIMVGAPAALAIFILALFALRHAQRFHAETLRRETAETALKQAQRLEAIGQLTGGVAHDFNNLLMVVAGNAERLKRQLREEPRARTALESIEIAVRRGKDLTRQLLSFSRQQTHEAKVIDLRQHLPGLQTMLQSSLRGDITIETRIADDLWHTRVDVGEFDVALLNLAVNARDAMTSAGRLTIAAANVTLTKPNDLDLAGEFVAVAVEDTGSGIAPDVLGRIFEPFFTTKDVGKGTGLGLSQVYGFARQAGGSAAVASEIGRGTTVTLYLPRSMAPVDADANGSAAAVPPRPREHLQVLLVEDNAEVAEVTRGFLEEFGCSVLVADNATAALAILHAPQHRVDLVLTDIVMPGGASGLDLARQVRQRHGSDLPVILATGYSDKAQVASDEGFPILRKPFDPASLHEAIRAAMRGVDKRAAG